MNYIVVYAWYPTPSQTRAIQDSLGIRIDPHHCVLPIVSPPIESEEKARQQLTALLDCWRQGPKENAFIQPEVCDLPTLSDQQASVNPGSCAAKRSLYCVMQEPQCAGMA